MTQKAQKIVSLFQELTLAELWTVVNAALARIHAQTEEIDIPELVINQVREDSKLYKAGKLQTFSVDEVINDIKSRG
ncbi:MAG: hypothetical protein KDD99_27340 [Bacteroidetes bacterium]|nr:hypothetical protein [Bacteroidota bacterium]